MCVEYGRTQRKNTIEFGKKAAAGPLVVKRASRGKASIAKITVGVTE